MSSQALPIVLIHRGNSHYLPVSLWQLGKTHPKSRVFLIGDALNQHYRSLVTHVNYADFIQEAAAFTSSYRHYSTNGYDYELFCVQRWFVLRAFMRHQGWKACVYVDSDVMVYGDLAERPPAVAQAGMTVAGISGHTNFINDDGTLNRFCHFIETLYAAPQADRTLKSLYDAYLLAHQVGGVSDMMLFTLFRKKYPAQVLDISVRFGDQTYDITLDEPNGYAMEGELKQVRWQNQRPYCYHLASNEWVRYHTLHFQGQYAKKRMRTYLPEPGFQFWLFDRRMLAIYYWQKIILKISKSTHGLE